MANFKELSRYTGGIAIKNRSGQNFLMLRKQLDLTEDEGDIFITVSQDIAGRPDLISYKAYGVPDLWWVIYEFNGISDPLFHLRTGQILRIPELNRVLAAISSLVI